jgi:hypothetical protein
MNVCVFDLMACLQGLSIALANHPKLQNMSSPGRDPLNGILREGQRIVGAISLPDVDVSDFVEQFNHCYGPLKLNIDLPSGAKRPDAVQTRMPVGAVRSVQPGLRPTVDEHQPACSELEHD